MRSSIGIRIKSLPRGGALFMSGLRCRDNILSVNGCAVADELDFYYHAAQVFLEIEIERGGRVGVVEVERSSGVPLEIEFYEKAINHCKNRCVFCFIDQMPKGLRGGLYVKDEDVKHSFLNGNYVTLTSLSQEDLRRAATIGLSPLFVSVHATDKKVRAKMLGNKNIPDVCEQLSFLRDNNIAFHTQIVVCPTINDGDVLRDTIYKLFSYGDALLSIAVVPVGLTKFRKTPLVSVDKNRAIEICKIVGELSDKLKTKPKMKTKLKTKAETINKLFLADEFFIKAELPIPPASYYEDYPQIENGVGLIRLLLEESAKIKRELKSRGKICGGGCDDVRGNDRVNVNANKKAKNILAITGQSAYPYLKKVLTDIGKYVNINFEVVSVTNNFLGETVTVAGLLCAKDVVRAVKKELSRKKYHKIILPQAMFNHAGYTLDGYSSSRIAKIIGANVKTAATIEEIL